MRSRRDESIASQYARKYQMAGTSRTRQEEVIRDIERRLRDRRISQQNKRFLQYISQFHRRR